MKKKIIASYNTTYCDDELEVEMHYKDFINEINSEFKKFINKNVYVNAKNIGWQSLEGTKEFTLNDTNQIFEEVIPNTNTLTFYLWKIGKNKYHGKCLHHDAPMGENYYYNIK
jgi:hypothetical protein